MLIISFPRSGQELISRLLYFLCLYYKKEYSYCDFYNCCKTLPCKKKFLYQKFHDFNLNLGMPRNNKINQLESWFRLEFKTNNKNVEINYANETTFKNMIDFINDKSGYYDGFEKKYVTSNRFPNSLIIEYDHFMSYPKYYIKEIITYLNLNDNQPILDSDIEYIINNFEKIEYKNRISDDTYTKIMKYL